MDSLFQSTLPCRERPLLTLKGCVILWFQSTLPCRERRDFPNNLLHMTSFNPRSRVGSDHCFPSRVRGGVLFQSTLPCRERPMIQSRNAVIKMFQSTLPCRERPAFASRESTGRSFQSTLPCRERLRLVDQRLICLLVSIHAPV